MARPPKNISDCYTREEAAERLRVSVSTIDRMKAAGDLQAYKISAGNKIYFSKVDVEKIATNLQRVD